MTLLEKPVHRVTRGALDGSYGPDRGRRLVATLTPGDCITLRPAGSRRPMVVSLFDVYRFAIRCQVNRALLEKARLKKEKLALRRSAQRQARAEARLLKP